MAGYTKPWMSTDDLLDKLIERGMTVTNRTLALECLKRIGYYRLSGYWHALRARTTVCMAGRTTQSDIKIAGTLTDYFKPGATFENAVSLYVFDKQLRLLAMDALERIEVSLRVDITDRLGTLDPFAYTNARLLHSSFSVKINTQTGCSRHRDWLLRHHQLISRSRDDSIQHCKKKYGLPLPIWVAAEIWDFGTMSILFSGMRELEQDTISAKYGISNGRTFTSWLRSLNYLRNVCAHHNRLWNRNVIDQPKLPSTKEVAWVTPFVGNPHALARCYLLLCIARHLLKTVNPRSTWPLRMKRHLQHFPQLAHLGLSDSGMGTHVGWESTW